MPEYLIAGPEGLFIDGFIQQDPDWSFGFAASCLASCSVKQNKYDNINIVELLVHIFDNP